MTIKEMYENNKKMEELKETIENHNAVIASGRKVDEKYFKQLQDAKDKLAGMKEISTKEIDEKVSEYEEIVDKYEKNNKRMKELSELIESHNAIIASGRNVPEGFFDQLKSFKEELANMKEVPKNEIISYKRQLAIAYEDKIRKAPEKNKEYDDLKELVDNHKSIISSGISVGEKYGDQYVDMEKKLSSMSRISEEDIKKWNKILEDVAKDDKEISQLKELIETHESMIKSGMKVGEKFGDQLEELKKQLAERTADIVKENEEKAKAKEEKDNEENKVNDAEDIQQEDENKEEENKQEETALAVVEKPNVFSRIGKSLKNLGSRIASLFKREDKVSDAKSEKIETGDKATGDTAKEWRKNFKDEYIKNLSENSPEVRKDLNEQAKFYEKGKKGVTPEVQAAREEANLDFDKDIVDKYYGKGPVAQAYYAGKDQNAKDNDFEVKLDTSTEQENTKDDDGR